MTTSRRGRPYGSLAATVPVPARLARERDLPTIPREKPREVLESAAPRHYPHSQCGAIRDSKRSERRSLMSPTLKRLSISLAVTASIALFNISVAAAPRLATSVTVSDADGTVHLAGYRYGRGYGYRGYRGGYRRGYYRGRHRGYRSYYRGGHGYGRRSHGGHRTYRHRYRGHYGHSPYLLGRLFRNTGRHGYYGRGGYDYRGRYGYSHNHRGY